MIAMATGNQGKDRRNVIDEKNVGHVQENNGSMRASQLWKRHLSNTSSAEHA